MTLKRRETALWHRGPLLRRSTGGCRQKRERETEREATATGLHNKHAVTDICCCKALIEDRKHNNNQLHDASKIQNQARRCHNKKWKTFYGFTSNTLYVSINVQLMKTGLVNICLNRWTFLVRNKLALAPTSSYNEAQPLFDGCSTEANNVYFFSASFLFKNDFYLGWRIKQGLFQHAVSLPS